MPETRSARKRMLASKRADVGSTRVVRIDVSEAMFRDCYVKPAGQKGANFTASLQLSRAAIASASCETQIQQSASARGDFHQSREAKRKHHGNPNDPWRSL